MSAIVYGCKFQVVCDECGERQPRATTAWTVQNWMTKHNAKHAAESDNNQEGHAK